MTDKIESTNEFLLRRVEKLEQENKELKELLVEALGITMRMNPNEVVVYRELFFDKPEVKAILEGGCDGSK